MPLFRKTAALSIIGVQVAEDPSVGRPLPAFNVEVSSGTKLAKRFLAAGLPEAAVGFLHFPLLNSVSLTFDAGRERVGLVFHLERNLGSIISLMKIGSFALFQRPSLPEGEKGQARIYHLPEVVEAFRPQWEDEILPDIIDRLIASNPDLNEVTATDLHYRLLTNAMQAYGGYDDPQML